MTTTTRTSGSAQVQNADVGERPPALAMTEMLLGNLWLGRTLAIVVELGDR